MKDFFNKMKVWGARPDVQKLTKQLYGASQVIGEFLPIKKMPIASMVATGVGLANRVINSDNESGGANGLRDLLILQGFEVYNGLSGQFLLDAGVFNDAKLVGCSGSWEALSAKSDNSEIAIIYDSIHDGIYLTLVKNFSKHALSRLLWDKLGCAAQVQFIDSLRRPMQLSLAPISLPSVDAYVPLDESPTRLVEEVANMHASGATPSYCFNGPPGCGKTTFALRVADLMGGHCILISANALRDNIGLDSLAKLISVCQPRSIILDDIDSCGAGGDLLSFVSTIKNSVPGLLLISTCNKWEVMSPALRRPGRLGLRKDFFAPDIDGRRKIITHYSQKFGINRDLSWIAEFDNHPLLTQDYLIDIVQQAIIKDDEGVRKHMSEIISHLNE